jgi:hypothetical protein
MTIHIATLVTKPGRILIVCILAAAILGCLAASLAIHSNDTRILLAPGPIQHTEWHPQPASGARSQPAALATSEQAPVNRF